MNQLILAVQILFTGVGNGIQPIISYSTGAKDQKAINYTLNKAIRFMAFMALLLMSALFFTRNIFPTLFNAQGNIALLSSRAILLVIIMIPFSGYVRVISAFFFASGSIKSANFLTYAEPFFMMPLLLVIFSFIMGSKGVWMAMLISQMILAVCGIALRRRTHKVGNVV